MLEAHPTWTKKIELLNLNCKLHAFAKDKQLAAALTGSWNY